MCFTLLCFTLSSFDVSTLKLTTMMSNGEVVNTLRSRQDGRHFADDIFKCIFLNENVWIPIKISLKFVPKGPMNNIPSLVQIMVWRRPGDKPLSEPMMVNLPTHICVTRPQWINSLRVCYACSRWKGIFIWKDHLIDNDISWIRS